MRITWPDAGPKADAVDYFDKGGTVEGIEAMIDGGDMQLTYVPHSRIKPGGGAILDVPLNDDPFWGLDTEIIAMKGEPFMIYGPGGVGKSTLAQQLMLR